MEQTFLTGIDIKKVRHLQDISIPLSDKKRKHLILTGKNGSGKTSVLEALVRYFQKNISYGQMENIEVTDTLERRLEAYTKYLWEGYPSISEVRPLRRLTAYKKRIDDMSLYNVSCHVSTQNMNTKYESGEFLLAYYSDERKFQTEYYKNVDKIELKRQYGITENVGQKFTKYLVDLKATQAFTKDVKKIQKIDSWFNRLESILRMIFEDSELCLKFDEETFLFSIHETGREVFDFNTMSSGYAAVLDIVIDLIMRMEAQARTRTCFDMEGIVLIDEIETHLHLEL